MIPSVQIRTLNLAVIESPVFLTEDNDEQYLPLRYSLIKENKSTKNCKMAKQKQWKETILVGNNLKYVNNQRQEKKSDVARCKCTYCRLHVCVILLIYQRFGIKVEKLERSTAHYYFFIIFFSCFKCFINWSLKVGPNFWRLWHLVLKMRDFCARIQISVEQLAKTVWLR